jgi:hypothetical protein
VDRAFLPCNNNGVRLVRFTQSARRHRIGKAHALAAMANAGDPIRLPAGEGLDQRLIWIGHDDRGVMLEVIAVEQPDYLLVIHVMPLSYRRQR